MSPGSPDKISTRQVVHFAFPPQRCKISTPLSSKAKTSLRPSSASKATVPAAVSAVILGIIFYSRLLQNIYKTSVLRIWHKSERISNPRNKLKLFLKPPLFLIQDRFGVRNNSHEKAQKSQKKFIKNPYL